MTPASTYTPDELARFIADNPDDVVPFVGAGLTLPAGAPSANELASQINKRLRINPQPGDRDEGQALLSAVAAAQDQNEVGTAQSAVAEAITGVRLRPTPAMIALTGVTSQVILTTNYDDGLERAARRRGLKPLSLLPQQPTAYQSPGIHELHVVHLHGLPGNPASLILPGTATSALEDDGLFGQFTRGALLHKSMVFLGFRLGEDETHLRALLRWVARNAKGGPRHYLMVPSNESSERAAELRRISGYGNVVVVPYEADARHSEVERVALAFAPRVERRSDHRRITWIAPPLIQASPEDQSDHDTTMRAIERGFGQLDRLVELESLLTPGKRSLVIASAGFGKTMLLDQLAGRDETRPVAIARLGGFQPTANGVLPELGIVGCLVNPEDETERVDIELLESADPALILLDGLDEIPADHWRAAVAAIAAASTAWTQHTWLVSSRPGDRAVSLSEHGFEVVAIPSSEEWARTYLQTRAVPTARVEEALSGSYAVGSLVRVPMYAARIADRLMDLPPTGRLRPLELILGELRAAAAREARKKTHGTPAVLRSDDLLPWLRSLAIGLEIAGETSASIDEIATIDASADPQLLRNALVDRALLADIPDRAQLPARPMQEALFADAILRSAQPYSALTRFAAAEIDGVLTLRNDIDYSLDLVFEEAEPDLRHQLRGLDELRWARTAIDRLDESSAREALSTILSWFERKDLAFWGAPSEGATLRTPLMAIEDIVGRYPTLLAEHTERLAQELTSPSFATRSRALELLGLGDDPRLIDWVRSALSDENRNLVIEAAEIARSRSMDATRDVLESLLESKDDTRRGIALRTLVALFSLQVVNDLKPKMPLRWQSIQTRIRDELDLDLGLRLVPRMRDNYFAGWALQQLVDTAHPDAWTERRVRALARCLKSVPVETLDLARIAQALAKHADSAIEEVRLTRHGEKFYGPTSQLLALRELLGPELPGQPAEMRAAVNDALHEQAERQQAKPSPGWRRDKISGELDEHGQAVSPDVFAAKAMPRDLEERHHDHLLGLVDLWWPAHVEDLLREDLKPTTRAALNIGQCLTAPLESPRWTQLLGGFARSSRLHREVRSPDIVGWLHDTFDPTDGPKRSALFEAIAAAKDGDKLSLLAFIGGGDAVEPAFARLVALGPETQGWQDAASRIAGLGSRPVAERLLALSDDLNLRRRIIGQLAKDGDLDARHEVIADLTQRLKSGERLDSNLSPYWQERMPIDPDAAADLVASALEREHHRLAAFGTQLLVTNQDARARAALYALADQVPAAKVLKQEVARLKRWRATSAVKERVPDTLGERVRWTREVLDGREPATASGARLIPPNDAV